MSTRTAQLRATRRTRACIYALALAAASVAAARPAFAAARVSNDIDGSFWSANASWQGGVVPVNGDTVSIGTLNSGNANPTLLFTSTYSGVGLSSLTINTTSVSTLIFAQSLGTMIATNEIVGDTVSGNTYSQNGGNNTVSTLILGNGTSGNGLYQLSGSGNLTAASLTVGLAGTGTFAQSGGNVTISAGLTVGGTNVASTSSYLFTGGNLTLSSMAFLTVGGGAHGNFTHSGGILNLNGGSLVVDNSSINANTIFYTLSGTGSIINANIEYIGNNGTGSAVFTQSGGSNTFGGGGTLELGYSGVGTYNLTNGTLSTVYVTIGDSYTSAFNQSGGNHTATATFNIGVNALGIYNLTNGTLTIATENVGLSNIGNFHQSGGTHSVANLTLGANALSNGTYILDNNVTASTLTAANETIGALGNATFTQNAGTHNVLANLYVGYSNGSTSTFSIAGGNLTLGNATSQGALYIGNGGYGYFTQTGGNVSFANSNGYLGISNYINGGGGGGSYTITAGSLTVPTLELGSNSAAAFYQNGGTASVTNQLEIASSAGESSYYYLNTSSGPATLTVGTEYLAFSGHAFFNQSGGTHTVTNGLYLGYGTGGSGNYTLSNGTLVANALFIGNFGTGNFIQNGGNVTLGPGASVINLAGTAGPGGAYTLEGGSLSTPNATGAFTINPGGSFTQSNYYANSTQSGYISNYGSFTYLAGTFNGTLENEVTGTVTIAPNTTFIAGFGIINKGSLSITSNISMGSNNYFDNENTLSLAGGSIIGTGAIVNNGFLSGYGTIGGTGGFTNSGYFSVVNGNLLFTPAGINTNAGTIALSPGRQFTLADPLTNNGTFSLANGLLNGFATLTNGASGSIVGPGTITCSLTNSGSISPGAGTLLIVNPWTNSGSIQPIGVGSLLTGGLITNSGSIQGAGTIAAPVTNSGTVEATGGGVLIFTAPLTNTGTLRASPNNKILIQGTNFPTNAGLIDLAGGTFDNGGNPLNNTGTIAGFGVFSTGGAGLTNNGNITFTGGTATINGSVTNTANHTLNIKYQPAIFTGNVTNNANATIKTTSTTATFTATFINLGNYLSDPSTNIFAAANNAGLMTGSTGDVFTFSSTFTNTGAFANGGNLNVTGNITNTGTFTQTGPQSWSSTSTFTNSGGTATFGSNAKLAGLIITAGTVDTTTSQLVIESPTKSTTLAALQSAAASGSLTSSTLPSNLALAIIDNASLSVPFTTFGGLPADSNSILIAPELLGDANIDGHVDLNDLNTVLNRLGTTDSNWTHGNFDGAATIDLNDLNAVLNHLGTTYANSSTVLQSQALLTASLSTVPEPSTLAFAFGLLPLLSRPRSRHRN